jgi:glycosyltransferase involved in cell wall biosynthesis
VGGSTWQLFLRSGFYFLVSGISFEHVEGYKIKLIKMQFHESESTPHRKINVIEIIGNADKGGMENFIKSFLIHLPKHKFSITCICPYESKFTDELRCLGVDDVYITRIEDDPYWRSIQLAVEIGRLKKINVFHAHMPKAHLLAGIAANLLKIPVVATVHGMDITAHELGIARAVGSHLITNNQEAYVQALALGISLDHLNLVRNGVDPVKFTPDVPEGETRNNLTGVPESATIIGFVGRLAHDKGPDLYLKVAELIHHQKPEIHFVIVGEGDMLKELNKVCVARHQSEYIHFLNWQEDTCVVYNSFDLLIHTSRSDGTSLVLLEAMSCGVPTVAINVGGIPEIVEHGVTGLLANNWEDVAAQVLYLLENEALRKAMSIAARARVNRFFNVKVNTEKTAGILQKTADVEINTFGLAERSFKKEKAGTKAEIRSLNA